MAAAALLTSTFLLALSLYAANLSILAITRLQSWESTTEAAATVSTAAATQLRRTRSTQGVAAGAVLLSASTALYLLLFPPGFFLLYAANGLLSGGAWYHFAAFWAGQSTVPTARQWNEAVEASQGLRTWLLVLAGAWGVAGVVGVVAG